MTPMWLEILKRSYLCHCQDVNVGHKMHNLQLCADSFSVIIIMDVVHSLNTRVIISTIIALDAILL